MRETVYRGEDVRAAALAPDGKMIAVAANGGLYIRSSETDTFKEFQVPGHADRYPFYVLCFSPDGKTIVGGGNAGLIQLCWPREQVELGRLYGLGYRVHALEYSRDGKLLAGASSNRSGRGADYSRVFDVETRREKQVFKGHETGVSALRISPDGETLATCGDSTVRLWEIATGKELWQQEACARGLAFSPDGKSLAVGALAPSTFRNPSTGEERATFGPQADLCILDPATGKERFRVSAHNHYITSVAYFPDGKRIVTMGQDGLAKVWEAATGKRLLPQGGHEGGVLSVAFTPDSNTLYSFGIDHALRRWGIASGKEQDHLTIPFTGQGVGDYQLGYQTAAFALAPDGKQLALVVAGEKSIQVFDAGSEKPRVAMKYPDWGLRSASFSPDGTLIVSTSSGDVKVWSTKTGELVRPLSLGFDLIRQRSLAVNRCAAFSPTRPLVAVGASGRFGALDLWDVSSGQCLLMLDKVGERVDHVTFSADGNLLAAVFGDRNFDFGRDKNPVVAVYEVATGALLGQFKLAEGTAHSAALSPDGRLLAAGSDGGKKNAVRVWDVYTGQVLADLEGHSAGVLSVAFSPDGKLLASGSLDTTILLWDVRKAVGKRPAPAESEKLPESCWADLAESDAKRGLGAVTALVRSPDRAVKLLKDQLKPAKEPDTNQVRTLIAHLDDPAFKVREGASEELAKLGDAVAPALKAALAKDPSAEAKQRLERLLAAFDEPRPTGSRLRETRAVQALEAIATPEARELLEALSSGAPASRLTHDAKAALARIDRRAKD
jgi:WD40 repeat protein